FVMHSSGARTFKVDLPYGTYSINITMGDNDYAHDNMIVKANGTTVLADVDAAVGGFTNNTFNVTVSGGSLAFEFSDGGGSDPTWVVNTLSIMGTVPPPPADCERAQFIADVTVPDGTTFAPATPFLKTWRLKNVGTCTWTTGYALIFDTGEKMGGLDSVPMPTNVAPGQTVNVSVNLTAPNAGGTYRGYWKFKNSVGAVFGIGSAGTKSFWVEIRVSGPTATPGSATPTFTPVPPVAGVSYDFAANACQGTWFSGAGQLPCPGTDGDSRGFVLKVTPSKLENGTNDGRMGLITFPQNVNNGYIQGFFPSYNVKAGDRFRSIVNCEVNATSCYVVFRLDYQTGTSSIQTFWAFVERYEGQYYQVDLDLSSLVGKDVKFILTVLATGSPTGDRALWVAPMIYNPSGVATPTNTPITPTATGTPVTPTATPTLSPTGYKYDFGTSLSPLAADYTRVIETTVYSAGGFGWTDTSGLESRDRSAVADDLNRDFVLQSSAARTFKVDLPSGNYSVSVTMGDNDYAHDNMIVKSNGITVLPDVNNAVGAFTTNTFAVTVSGGSLALEFSDAGGADPTWIVNSVSITAAP
ncbi:MAG: NBR1-Ig-like domain-containing protein, partial [Anaerolineales bacterium]|nr:NBR1-Ig-like domain-containing protein [Anaerolineales bacterium]